MTTGAQQLSFHLASGDCARREEFVDSIVRSIESFAPGFESSIRGSVSITPLDLQRTYGLPEGNIFHGAMSINQLFASRQVAGSTGLWHADSRPLSVWSGDASGWRCHGCGRAQRRHVAHQR